ncbi:SseB family protein [Spirillospora sp. NPDC048819]|uniref:TY-Chap domain-containing protein n=1 Tax=Spirillospora sp. NPDC048819 TaxID=3155268 RepID=UPI00340C4867
MLEWSEFARRLGRELAGLERDTILIVRERDESRHYVQAMREPDRLYAEAVSNNFLDGPLLLTLADEEVMSDAGWRPPAEPAPRNWWTELPEFGVPGGMLSVSDVDFSRLAEVMVTALRDVQGVRRPSDLVYESFHRHGTGLIELLDFGIDVADASRVNQRRSSSGGPVGEPSGGPLAGADPLPAGTPPAGTSMPPQAERLPGADADLLEPRLAEAKANGDNTTYFRLLADADLVLPATASAVEDPDRAEFPTTAIGSDTYVTVFTSPGALARTGDRHPGLYRRTSFARLAAGWPDPAWRLAINWGLPSEVLLDSSVIPRLHASPDVSPPAEPDVPNPYGTVDPNALAGPNPVAGGSVPAVNGSAPSADSADDDAHTAVDPFTAADLRAALEAGDPALPVDAGAAAEAGPAEPQPSEPMIAGSKSPAPEPLNPPHPEPPAHPKPEPLRPEPIQGEHPEPERLQPEPVQPERPQSERAQPEHLKPELLQPERVQAEPVQAEPVQAERLEPEHPQPERVQSERPQAERLEPERLEPERLQPERLQPERLEPERPQAEHVQPERPESERPQAKHVQPEQVQPEHVQREHVQAEGVQPERLEPERPQGERVQPKQVQPERVQPERLDAERLQGEHLQPERVQVERLGSEGVQRERLESERPEPGRVQAEAGAALPLGAPTSRQSAVPEQRAAGVPIRLPHGARLWRWTGDGDETPLAVYDAVGGVWAPVRADAVPAPRTE